MVRKYKCADMHMRVYTHILIRTSMYVSVYIHKDLMYSHMQMCTYRYIHRKYAQEIYMYIYAHVHKHMNAQICTYIHIHVSAHVWVHVYMKIHGCTHT